MEILEKTASFLHIQVTDVRAHRIDNQQRLVIVIVGAGQKFKVCFDDLGLHDDKLRREATTIAGPPDPEISPVGPLEPLFTLFEQHLTKAAIQTLQEAGLLDAAKLRRTSDEELLKLPGIGKVTLEVIREIQDKAL
jgi:hypothetical protein